MKKIIGVLVVLVLVSCGKITIEEQIDNLADAINRKSYSDFRDCFHKDCNLNSSFTRSQFESASFYGNKYEFKNVKVSGSKATAVAHVTDDLDSEERLTNFAMKEDDEGWKILVWDEAGTELYHNIIIAPPYREEDWVDETEIEGYNEDEIETL